MHIVLVHGAGGTPATWNAVAPLLAERGYSFSLSDNPSQSLEEDVALATALVDAVAGPVLLVGHSYGGAVITNVGTHDRVTGLVYVAAFAPDQGESVQHIVGRYDPAEISAYMRRGDDGEWFTDRSEAFWNEIAWDVAPEDRASFESERRVSANAIFAQTTGAPAWAVRPSWYLVASGDKTLRPDTQRDMAARAGASTTEINTSHDTPRIAPERVVDLIESAVRALS
jgi:pimeloyl-ACP methyl ester carboxylesterase